MKLTKPLLALLLCGSLTTSCSNKPRIDHIISFSSNCETGDGIEGELFVDSYKTNGKATYDIEWYLGETYGASMDAPAGGLSNDYMVFGDPNGEALVQLSRPPSTSPMKPASYQALFVIVDSSTKTAQVIEATCDDGYWG